jgi:hypothetical protein
MTTDTYTARISTTRELKALNSLAITNNYSRAISDTGIKLLDPDGIHLVDFTMVHNDDHMRIGFLSKFINVDEPIHLWVDASFEDFEEYTSTIGFTEGAA